MERLTWDDIEALADANWHRRDAQGTMLDKVRAQFHAYTVELADAQATVEALQDGFKAEEQRACRLQRQLHDERAKVVELGEQHERDRQYFNSMHEQFDKERIGLQQHVEALQRENEDERVRREQVSQLQALVQEVDSLLRGIIKRNQGGYVGDKDDIRKAISLIATLDATTPAKEE